MKYLTIKYLLLTLSIGFLFADCKKDFLDVNTDPNRATDNNITPALIFPAAAEAAGTLIVGARAEDAGAKTTMQYLQNWVGYMAPNGDFARDNNETTYDIDFGFNDRLFQRRYNCLFDLRLAELKSLELQDSVLAGAAIILSVKVYQETVDLFGNIPYKTAFSITETNLPTYDNQVDIYKDLLLRLDTAIEYMGHHATTEFETIDIVNHGDQNKWIKFANTLKLRILIRQSEVGGFDPAPEIAKITATGGVLLAGETVSVNPGYIDDLNKQSPYYANYGFTPTGIKAATSTNANVYIVDILTTSLDPRIAQFFTPVGTSYVGAVYGDEPGNIPPGASTSYFGPALIGSAQQDQWLLPSYESLFFVAEATARGWIPGDVRTAYEDAVRESFVYLGVEDAEAEAETYLAEAPIANFDNAGSSVAEQVKFIAFPKYIANTGIDPQESYSDQRRLNFLPPGYISVNPGRVSNTLPVRMLYPQTEYTTNADNVLKEGTIDPFNTKLFWIP